MKRTLVLAVSSVILCFGRDVLAGDVAAAQALFDDAKRLVGDGNYAAACPKLEESQKLDAGMGTLFHLADCYEHVGKTASAWGAFLDVAAQAKAQGQAEREQAAATRAAAIAPRLVKLSIQVRTPQRGLRVERDGSEVGPGQLGTSVPVDPGEHTVVASAPGMQSWRSVIHVTTERSEQVVIVPPLEPEAAAPASAVPAPTVAQPEDPGSDRRLIGLAVGGAGVVGVGIGTAFGLMSQAKRDEVGDHCDATKRCDATGVSLRDDAMERGTISTIAFVAGIAGLAGGALLYFTAPKKSAVAVSAAPAVASGTAALVLRGTW